MISKCPEILSQGEKAAIKKRVKPLPGQQLFFSHLDYGHLVSLNLKDEKPLSEITTDTTVFLLTGIANPQPLWNTLDGFSKSIIHHDYPDHHNFSTKNITKLVDEFNACKSTKKLIITTEKDSQRLQFGPIMELLNDLPVYYLPISAKIHQLDEERFNSLIENYVAEYIQHNSIH
jgi:tetraacyldisaccharide 4'-kinase